MAAARTAPRSAAAPRRRAAGARARRGTPSSPPGGDGRPARRAPEARGGGRPPRRRRSARGRPSSSRDLRSKGVPQLLEAKPHPALDGPERHAEHLRDLRVREPAEVGEVDHLALLVGQGLDRLADRPRLVAPGNLELGALGRLLTLLDALGARPSALMHEVPAQRVDAAVVNDPQDPRPDAAALALVAQATAPDRQKGLLRDVLGDRTVAHHSVRQREGGAAVPVVDRLEGAGVAIRDEVHELLVGETLYVLGRDHALAPAQWTALPADCTRDHLPLDQRPRRLRTSVVTSRMPFCSARRPRASRRRCFWRARTTTSAPPAVPATTPAATRRAQPRGSRSALESNSASSSTAASVSSLSRRSSRVLSASDGSTGTSAPWSSRSTSLIANPFPLGESLLELPDRAMDQHLGRALGASESAGDLAVVHTDREAHDQRLAAIVRKAGDPAQDGGQLLPLLDQLLGPVRGRDDRGVLEVGLRAARAVAVVVRREVVGDPDQPGPERPPVRLRSGALEVPVRLEEGLLREVLGVVVVAHLVVAVAVDVAQVGAVELGELAIQLAFVGGRRRHAPSLLPRLRSGHAPDDRRRGRLADHVDPRGLERLDQLAAPVIVIAAELDATERARQGGGAVRHAERRHGARIGALGEVPGRQGGVLA